MIEERLRTGLHDHVAGLDPDLETTLDSIVSRARRRRRTVQVGLLAAVSAACVAAVLLIGPDGVLRSEDPPHPVEQPKHSGEVVALHAGVGELFAPAPIEPGRYLVDFLDAGAGTSAVVSVPEGWGQDDDVALAAGPAVLSNVRRLELWTVASVPPTAVTRPGHSGRLLATWWTSSGRGSRSTCRRYVAWSWTGTPATCSRSPGLRPGAHTARTPAFGRRRTGRWAWRRGGLAWSG